MKQRSLHESRQALVILIGPLRLLFGRSCGCREVSCPQLSFVHFYWASICVYKCTRQERNLVKTVATSEAEYNAELSLKTSSVDSFYLFLNCILLLLSEYTFWIRSAFTETLLNFFLKFSFPPPVTDICVAWSYWSSESYLETFILKEKYSWG